MITLDYADKRPLYEQTVEKLRELIVTGILKPHDRIPSVRVLAASLSINPNTIQKAYRQLETEGYIYSVTAKGNYVSPRENAKDAEKGRKEEIYSELRTMLAELKFLSAQAADIEKIVAEVFGADDKSN